MSRDVLPSGVRRRLSRRDLRLPAVLMGELLAGMALGVAWPQLTAAPPPVPQTAMTAVSVPVKVPPTVPTPAAVPVVTTHAPRNPFGPPAGIDLLQQAPVASVPLPAAVAPSTVVPPTYPGGAPAPAAPAPAAPAPRSAVTDSGFADLR